MSTDTPDDEHMTRTDYLREAEARHGEVAIKTTTADLIQYWTPCYEILGARWIAFNKRHGEAAVARLESLQMTLSDPQTDVTLVPWEMSPFSDEVGVDE
jgi:hypothetical protein